MQNHRRRRSNWLLSAVVAIVGVPLLASCGVAPVTQSTTYDALADAHQVMLLAGQDVFAPFILAIQPQTTVTWQNDDTIGHVIRSTPEQSSYLNNEQFNLTVAPHHAVKRTFTAPGLYHYFDDTVSSWSTDYQRVAPNKGVPKFPQAMEGIIWVQGPIAGLPLTALNHIVHLKDQIADNFVAIQAGGTVGWQNYDTDAHFFQPVLGYDAPINPVDIGINNLGGTNLVPPDGESKSITFKTPGLYYYYCFTHASIDPVLLRGFAHDNASEYPIPMEGFVLVV